MMVLAINCGSATLKFQAVEIKEGILHGKERRVAHGIIEKIGSEASARFSAGDGELIRENIVLIDHTTAFRRVVDWLRTLSLVERNGIDAMGHRIVHGGHRFLKPTLITSEVTGTIECMGNQAPLHNNPSLTVVRAAQDIFNAVPMVAVFDTAFHSTMPEKAANYAIPKELAMRHHIRRYGFHGLAHRCMAERYAAMASPPMDRARLITLQIGNGCSATAVEGGVSVDTSMGFTPLEGLIMGTRSGDVDPSLPGFLARAENRNMDVVEDWLNTKSGLLGVSGISHDMRDLLAAEKRGYADAVLAIDMFCYRIRKQIGAYMAGLGGANALIFGGGIGENSPEIRSRICAGMEWCGLVLDEERNAAMIKSEGCISRRDSLVEVYVVSVDEEVLIARDTARCVSGSGPVCVAWQQETT